MHVGLAQLPDRERIMMCHRALLTVVASMAVHMGRRDYSPTLYLLRPSIKSAESLELPGSEAARTLRYRQHFTGAALRLNIVQSGLSA
jgi:hypothetical protein